ncbi:MAG: hypothetical protein KAU21_01345, partial [Gammaproteobacteria bacterium]|nr:hypothetical protein [Gammaproteobacteria bacterium]
MISRLKKARSVAELNVDIDLNSSAQELSLDESSDEALMLLYAKGDSLAFNKLYERYRQALYRYMRRNLYVSESVLDEL